MTARLASAIAAACTIACAGDVRLKGELVPVQGISASDVERAAGGKRIALLIGVDQFDDVFWPSLAYARKDADDLAAVLRDRELGRFDDVVVLQSPEETKRQRVLDAVTELKKRASSENDAIVLYVSAHGTLAIDPFGAPERILVLRDTLSSSLHDTGLPVRDLIEAFDALPSKKKVLILATCHSGSGKSLLTPEVEAELKGRKGRVALEDVSRASIVLSAADFGQPAREDERLENDVYTHFLIEALTKGADANNDGAVSATEAHDFARRKTFEFTEGRQTPAVFSTIVGADPVLLAGRLTKPGLPVLYGYAERLFGLEVRSRGQLKGVFPGNIVLDAGEQEITLARKNGEVIARDSIDLQEGDHFAAESLLDRATPRNTIELRGGVLAFLDSGAARGVAPPLASASLAFRMRDTPWTDFDPIFDLTFATSRQTVRANGVAIAQRLSAYQLGVGFAWARDAGPFRLFVGPHLSYLLAVRSIELDDFNERQTFGTFLPGVLAGGALPLDHFQLALEGRVHYLPLVLDGKTRSVALTSIFFGGGYRF